MSSGSRECEKVFVYGTLRRGERYRYLIEALIVKEQPATIRGTMYHYAPGGGEVGEFPYIVPGRDRVHGEAISFQDLGRALEILDRIESAPEFYVREVVEATYPDGERESVYAYFIRPGAEAPGRRIESGDWLAEGRGR